MGTPGARPGVGGIFLGACSESRRARRSAWVARRRSSTTVRSMWETTGPRVASREVSWVVAVTGPLGGSMMPYRSR